MLGVRDWRCYGIVLLWPPVISAIQTGNVTLWLGLRARLRGDCGTGGSERSLLRGDVRGQVLLVAAARLARRDARIATAALALAVGVVLLVASWAAIGFDGLRGYPDLLQRLEDVVGDDAYTVFNLASDLGAPDAVARALWLALGLALLAAVVVLGRRVTNDRVRPRARGGARPDADRLAALLRAARSRVALARPRLGVVWFVPLAMFVAPGAATRRPGTS